MIQAIESEWKESVMLTDANETRQDSRQKVNYTKCC